MHYTKIEAPEAQTDVGWLYELANQLKYAGEHPKQVDGAIFITMSAELALDIEQRLRRIAKRKVKA